MAWSASAMFGEFIKNPLFKGGTAPTGYDTLDADVVKAALFDSSITPNKDASLATTGYNSASSQWLTADEVTHANWPAGGIALSTDSLTLAAGTFTYDAADTTHSSTVTLADVNGCLVYDDDVSGGTVVDQGICYNWFGGAQSVTAGTFTIVWHANGIFRLTF